VIHDYFFTGDLVLDSQIGHNFICTAPVGVRTDVIKLEYEKDGVIGTVYHKSHHKTQKNRSYIIFY